MHVLHVARTTGKRRGQTPCRSERSRRGIARRSVFDATVRRRTSQASRDPSGDASEEARDRGVTVLLHRPELVAAELPDVVVHEGRRQDHHDEAGDLPVRAQRG